MDESAERLGCADAGRNGNQDRTVNVDVKSLHACKLQYHIDRDMVG